MYKKNGNPEKFSLAIEYRKIKYIGPLLLFNKKLT